MAAEPIVIYSHKIDPAGVLDLLRRMAPDLTVDGGPDDWSTITITGPRKFLRKPPTLSFGHDSGYYRADDFHRIQMNGMQGYFARFPENERTGSVMALIDSFRFALTLFPVPNPELDITSDDPRLQFIFAVVRHLDGALFTPSALRDANGRVLYGAGDPDPDAVMPAIKKDVPAGPVNTLPRSDGGLLPDPEDAPPPTPARVARRACALAAVAARGLLEQEDASDPGVDATRLRLIEWVNAIGVGDELEPDEWKILQLPLGVPPQQDVFDATWRIEGLAMLAWALRLFDWPAYDQQVDPGKLLPAVAILNADRARAILDAPSLRPSEELRARQNQLFAFHWRVRDFGHKRKPLDFVEFARTAWFGPLDVTDLRIAPGGDLLIGDQPISQASPGLVGALMSTAQERHLALNWLNGGSSETYSETDVHT
jgi:hypothetical protein